MISIILASFFPTGAMPPMPTPTAIALLRTSASSAPTWTKPEAARISWHGSDGYINVPLPASLNAGAPQSLTSLRLSDEQHHEVPYVLDPNAHSTPRQHHIVFWANHVHQYTADWNSQTAAPHYAIGDRWRTGHLRTVAVGQLLLASPPPAPAEAAPPLWQQVVEIGLVVGTLSLGIFTWNMYRHR